MKIVNDRKSFPYQPCNKIVYAWFPEWGIVRAQCILEIGHDEVQQQQQHRGPTSEEIRKILEGGENEGV